MVLQKTDKLILRGRRSSAIRRHLQICDRESFSPARRSSSQPRCPQGHIWNSTPVNALATFRNRSDRCWHPHHSVQPKETEKAKVSVKNEARMKRALSDSSRFRGFFSIVSCTFPRSQQLQLHLQLPYQAYSVP